MSPGELTEDLMVSHETPDTIRARLIADINAGIDPNDPAYADHAPGSFVDDHVGAFSLEGDRIYDRGNEAVAAGVPSLASGAALDEWALSTNLTRKDATFAEGLVKFTGPDGTIISAGTEVSTIQTSEETEAQSFQVVTGGTIDGTDITLEVRALDEGFEGNVPANTVTILDTSVDPDDATSVTNLAAITGGSDVETDEALSERVLRKLRGGAGGGNQADYENWSLDTPGVGFVTVQANEPDFGHVTIVITDVANDPFSGSTIIDALQEKLDPSATPAQGKGLAPVGATVHVTTPTATNVTIAGALTLAPGYTLDGTGGSQELESAIDASVTRYVNSLKVGADVVLTKVIAAIVDVPGVEDVDHDTLTINTVNDDLAIATDHVASLIAANWTA